MALMLKCVTLLTLGLRNRLSM